MARRQSPKPPRRDPERERQVRHDYQDAYARARDAGFDARELTGLSLEPLRRREAPFNLQMLCPGCHAAKTSEEAAWRARVRRGELADA